MAASINDKATDTFNSANPNVARVTSTRTALGATLACDNLAGWPTGTAVHFSTYQINTSNAVVAGTQIDWKGIVSGNNIGTMTRQAGATDAGNTIGDVVEMNPTGSWGHDWFTAFTNQHKQLDGSHGTVTADSVTVATTGDLNAQGVGKLKDNATALTTIRTEYQFDFVASGMVWSGDSYGASLNASMTAGVVYINGRRIAISAVTARAFTLNVDTYIDVLDNADGTGTLVYTTAATNTASPPLAANSLRIGIIQAAATITAATKVNQGQEDRVFPIASSIAYSVTDSLGNLICPRDPNRKTLGYRQVIGNLTTTSTTVVQATGLTVPVIIPTNRKIKITSYSTNLGSGTAGQTAVGEVWDGTVGSGTKITQWNSGAGVANGMALGAITTASGSKTYNVGFYGTSGTITFGASATNPGFVLVELM